MGGAKGRGGAHPGEKDAVGAKGQDMGEITALWQEAEQHLRAFEQLARRTVEEAWLAGDALLRIKEQLPHGAWTPALEERGIPVRTARRFIQLRQKYPQIGQIVRFDSVSTALTDGKARKDEKISPTWKASPTYLVSADDLWDWERGEATPLARRFLNEAELTEFSRSVLDAERQYARECGSRKELAEALTLFRLALSCVVDIGLLERDPDAIAETERRVTAFYSSQADWIDDPNHFLRISVNLSGRLDSLEATTRAPLMATLNGKSAEETEQWMKTATALIGQRQ